MSNDNIDFDFNNIQTLTPINSTSGSSGNNTMAKVVVVGGILICLIFIGVLLYLKFTNKVTKDLKKYSKIDKVQKDMQKEFDDVQEDLQKMKEFEPYMNK